MRISLLGLSLLALFLLVEVGSLIASRTPGVGDRLTLFRSRYLFESEPQLVPHPFLILVNNPAAPGSNDLGFIDRERSLRKEAGVYRIACLGGSTTQDGYPRRLEALLAERYPRQRFEVINFGNPAWTSAQLLINYLLNVRDFSPDLLLVLTGANELKVRGYAGFRSDYAHAFGPLTKPPARTDAALVAGWNSYALLKWAAWSLSGREPGYELTHVIQRPGNLDRPLRLEELAPFERNLRELVVAARRNGSEVVLASEPFSRARLEWGGAAWVEHMSQVGESVRRVAEEEGTLRIDLDSAITGQEELFVDPIHLSVESGVPAKARAIADALGPHLESWLATRR